MPAPDYWRLSGFYFLYFALLGAILPYFNLYLDAIGLDAKAIGTLSAALMATRIFAPSLWGWLADRSGHRVWIIRLGCLLAMLSLCGLLLSNEFLPLLLTVTLFSAFWNAVLPQYEVVTLATLGANSHRYGQIRLWGSISFVLVVMLAGWLFDVVSVRHLPWLLISLQALLLVGSLKVREPPRVASQGVAGGLGDILRQPTVIGFFACCFLMLLSHGPFYTFYSLYLQAHGYSRTMTGLLWSLGVVAEVLLFLLIHRLLPQFGVRRILLASLALAVLRWLLTAAFADSLVVMIAAQLLHAATYGAFHAAGILLVTRHFGVAHHGQGQALYSATSFGLGGALGAWLSGLAWVNHAQASFVAAAGVAGIAWLVAFRWIREDGDAVLSWRPGPTV